MNFYVINPTYMKSLFGMSNSSNLSFIFQFIGAISPASIHRHGFRPLYKDTNWFNDGTGHFGQSGSGNFQQLVAQLTILLSSYHEPVPLMAKGVDIGPLRPDIIPGNRYTFSPFKGEESWDFYINAVKHSYVFGGPSTTALTITRGFPSSIYSDTSMGGVLTQAHLGNAMRKDGVLQVGLPPGIGGGLQMVTPSTIPGMAAILSNNSLKLSTPQS
jgi:hypothetical protein